MRLLLLLWLWALCVFLVVDLFLNVPEFDRVRPRAPLYRGMRSVAHEMVGEPLNEAQAHTLSLPHLSLCLVPRASDIVAWQPPMMSAAERGPEGATWRRRLDRPLLRAVELMEGLDVRSGVAPFMPDFTDQPVTNEEVTYRYATSVRTGSTDRGKVVFREGGGLYVVGRLGAGAEVLLREGGGIAVTEDLAGSITMREGTVYVGQNLTGTLTASANIVLLIDGDLEGNVEIGNSGTVFVRGRVTGQLRVRPGGRCRLFLEGVRQAEELAAMPGEYRECVLYLPELADFAEGLHEVSIGSWRRIMVGGEFWQQVR